MKVALLSDCYPPRLGGIETQVRDLGRALLAQGHEVHVYTATPGIDEHRGRSWEDDEGVHVHRVAMHVPFGVPVNPRAPKLIRGELAEFDIAHVHMGVIAPFAHDLTKLSLDLGLPTAITWHSVLGQGSLTVLRQLGWAREWAQRGATLTAVSSMAADRVRAAVGDPGIEVGVLPNGISIPDWSLARGRRPDDAPVQIVTALRFALRKRILPLIRMLREVRRRVPEEIPFTATVFGNGPYLAPARALTTAEGRTWLNLAGRVARPVLAQTYADSDLYFAPTRLEAFGIAALEARTAGLPVVALRGSGVEDFITNEENGLLAKDDDALVDAAVRLVTDHHLRHRLREHNLTVPPAQGWDSVVQQSLAEYRRAGARG